MKVKKRRKKMGNKGFSLVEILAVIVIIGIMTSIGIAGYTRYKEKAMNQNMDALVRSTLSAFDEYLMDHPNETTAFSSKLISEEYLSNDVDPYNKDGTCTIRVERINIENTESSNDGVKANDYRIYSCCANRSKNYTYTYIHDDNIANAENIQVQKNSQCQAGYDVDKLYSNTNPTLMNNIPATNSSLKSKNIAIYTMKEEGKNCNNTSGVNYSYCLTSQCTNDPQNLHTGKIYNPYRKYDYHTYGCTCYYNKSDNGYAGYGRRTSADSSHKMYVFYLENSNGVGACNSNDSTMFNKYVHHVCTWGVFLNGATKINFHGYQWYRDNSGDYGAFTPDGFWYHDGEPFEWKAEKEEGDTPDNGCAKTCLYMTPYWGGKTT